MPSTLDKFDLDIRNERNQDLDTRCTHFRTKGIW